uniref:Putative tick transposon n=1 Tax=Ixodes ricinus TaxID=34613 RepID=A0A6B0V0W7_IXORI
MHLIAFFCRTSNLLRFVVAVVPQVLKRLQDAGITLNKDKCVLHKQSVEFLGHVVSANGVSADPVKIKALAQLTPPGDVLEVRSFLGMANHLAKFLPGLSQLTKPLRDLLHHDADWCWGEPQQKSFDSVKEALTTTPVLVHYDPRSHLTVSADASSYSLGAVLLQETSGKRVRRLRITVTHRNRTTLRPDRKGGARP